MSNTNPALSESEERNYAALGNILGIIIGFISPLIFWLMYKERSAFVDRNLKNALNFQISLVIYYIAGWILSFFFIGIFVVIAAGIVNIIFCIMAFVATKDGRDYKYPLTIPFIK